jgi:hypothetical protein
MNIPIIRALKWFEKSQSVRPSALYDASRDVQKWSYESDHEKTQAGTIPLGSQTIPKNSGEKFFEGNQFLSRKHGCEFFIGPTHARKTQIVDHQTNDFRVQQYFLMAIT